jgi:hypothetical protein
MGTLPAVKLKAQRIYMRIHDINKGCPIIGVDSNILSVKSKSPWTS